MNIPELLELIDTLTKLNCGMCNNPLNKEALNLEQISHEEAEFKHTCLHCKNTVSFKIKIQKVDKTIFNKILLESLKVIGGKIKNKENLMNIEENLKESKGVEDFFKKLGES